MDWPDGAFAKSIETVTVCEPPGGMVKDACGDHEIQEPEVSREIEVTERSAPPSLWMVNASEPEPPAGA